VVYSARPGRGQEVADLPDTGMVWISSRRAPGRPAVRRTRAPASAGASAYGIDEFVNKKLIYTPAPR
jgi:succinate-semialdehyde dehydrogenase/glutarate-semialdehyde dehydrogenase